MFHFTTYIIAPQDSVYRHKLIKLEFEIPREYPLRPPRVRFVQHVGERIHPNLYVDGKVCLSILGTWEGEPWAYGMTCHSVLVTIRSLLDEQPYLHEPGQKDHPGFNDYVRYTTWRWLLLDYVDRETDPAACAWLQCYLRRHGPEMLGELRRQARVATAAAAGSPDTLGCLRTPYKTSSSSSSSSSSLPLSLSLPPPVRPDYNDVIGRLEAVVKAVIPAAATAIGPKEKEDGGPSGSGNKAVRSTIISKPVGDKRKFEQVVVDLTDTDGFPQESEKSSPPRKRKTQEDETTTDLHKSSLSKKSTKEEDKVIIDLS